MKFRRIRVDIGDLFLAPFEPKNANYSEEWTHQWIPQKGEECFLMQNIGMKNNSCSDILTALYDEIYHYGINTDNIDVQKSKTLAIADIVNNSFKVGEFKKIDNQLIPKNMPYMAYNRANQYITPLPDCHIIIEKQKDIENLPFDGMSITGGLMYSIANYFIKNTKSPELVEYLLDDIIDSVRVRPEAAVYKFFPEAKNNPNWVISQLGNNVQVQDREKYKN